MPGEKKNAETFIRVDEWDGLTRGQILPDSRPFCDAWIWPSVRVISVDTVKAIVIQRERTRVARLERWTAADGMWNTAHGHRDEAVMSVAATYRPALRDVPTHLAVDKAIPTETFSLCKNLAVRGRLECGVAGRAVAGRTGNA